MAQQGYTDANIIHGIKKIPVGGPWGTPVELGVGNGIRLIESTLKATSEALPVKEQGQLVPTQSDRGPVKGDGTLKAHLRYDAVTKLMAGVHGLAGAPSINGPGPGYSYDYAFADHIDGIFYTYASLLGGSVSEFPTVKINGYTVTVKEGAPAEITFDCIPVDEVQNTTGGTNNITTMQNLTTMGETQRVYWAHSNVLINDQTGVALADPANIIKPSGVEFSFKRPLEGSYTGLKTKDEPYNSAEPEFSLKLFFPRHLNTTRWSEMGMDTRKKLIISLTGKEVSVGVPLKMVWEFPHLQYKDVTKSRTGIISEDVEFQVLAATAPPAGFAHSDAVRLKGTNTGAVDPLL